MRFMLLLFMTACVACLLTITTRADSRKLVELNLDVSQDPDMSFIIIDSSQSYEVRNQTNISVPLKIYRGATLKRTVYLWIEKDGTRISSKSKHSLPARFSHYNISASVGIVGCHLSGDYAVVAQGIGLDESKIATLHFQECEEGARNIVEENSVISFEIGHHESEIITGVSFKTRILILNPTEQHIEVDAWSYVYRSSRSYSGERESNRKTINTPDFANITFDLINTVDATPGDYNLKIKILRSDRKTPKEFTFPIKVIEGKAGSEEGRDRNNNSITTDEGIQASASIVSDPTGTAKKRKLSPSILLSTSAGDRQKGELVYESSSAKAKRLAVYFLILVLVIVFIALIFKRL